MNVPVRNEAPEKLALRGVIDLILHFPGHFMTHACCGLVTGTAPTTESAPKYLLMIRFYF